MRPRLVTDWKNMVVLSNCLVVDLYDPDRMIVVAHLSWSIWLGVLCILIPRLEAFQHLAWQDARYRNDLLLGLLLYLLLVHRRLVEEVHLDNSH